MTPASSSSLLGFLLALAGVAALTLLTALHDVSSDVSIPLLAALLGAGAGVRAGSRSSSR